ncbi:MAG: hypothetical protein NC301_02220 [Bacteroides sp.]|nr:hypothetical protein [Bacteroides sp.]MCM1379081.1 hypothetical protein [Bacteroides sp.]MCM1445779.1 hypothetical protein [Prevotella sp.]
MTTKLYHIVREWLRDLIEGTQWEGHVFAVGGCCRDEITGHEIKDLDLAVDLPDGGVKFARWLIKQHQTLGRPIFFLKYGTAKIRLRRFPDDEIELVQTRREQYTKETSRCPEVCYGTIEEDCFRRDFTVNSLYYDITRRLTVDITGKGIEDMHSGLLRTPLDPDMTFNDDPVRILRGLRFANRFNWRIDPPVYQALLRHIHRLEIVSRERVHSELCKMLNGPDPVGAMESLRETGALSIMIPQMDTIVRNKALWNEAMTRLRTILSADTEARTRYRLAALFMGLAPKADEAARITRTVMIALRFDRPIVSDVVYLVRFANIGSNILDNWRQVRMLQNLAVTQRRLDFLCGFMIDLGRTDEAARLRNESNRLVRERKSGFATEKSGKANKNKDGVEAGGERPKRRRRRRGGYRRK